MSNRDRVAIRPQDLLVDIYASLSRATDWITRAAVGKQSQYRQYDDLDGICTRISGLYVIMDNGLHMFRSDTSGDLDTPCKKAQWLDKWLRRFGADLGRFVGRYLEGLVSERIPPPYALRDLEPVFASCAGCTLRFRCLYVFKDVFSILNPSIILSSSKDSILSEVYKSNSENIRRVLEKLFVQSEDMAGWPCAVTHREEIDVYITSSILSVLLQWQNQLDELHLSYDFSVGSRLFELCIGAVYKLQEKEKEEKFRELIGDSIDVKGSWKEYYWGEYLVNRIKSTASIAKTLYNLGGREDAIRSARAFVDRAFGKNPYCVDLVSYRDTICATVSDISGTVSALDMYLTLGKDYGVDARDVQMLTKVRWLIDQQRRDGAWPILSKTLLDRYEPTSYIRDNLRYADGYEKHNVSLPNTVGAMKALTTFLKMYLEEG